VASRGSYTLSVFGLAPARCQVYFRLGRRADALRVLTAGEALARRAGQTGTAANFLEILQSL